MSANDKRIARIDAKVGELLEQRARLIARAAERLEVRLAPKRAGRPPLDTSTLAPLVVLALAILVPALRFFGTKTRTAAGCLIAGAKGYCKTSIGPGHRVALMFATGRVAPDDRLVCHKCDVKPCVEPTHLYEGTSAENNADTVARGRHRGVREKSFPSFKTWREWVLGGWDCEDSKDPHDAEGAGFEISEHELPRDVRQAVADAPVLRAYDDESVAILNPDLWSEEDERSLMVLGHLDGREPRHVFTRVWSQNRNSAPMMASVNFHRGAA